jgi:tRNA (cytidine/uridine-2'-O-)-methyltransferase
MTPFTNPSWTPPSSEDNQTSQLFLKENSGLAVVLVEPRIPQNTGNIARLCACTGAELYLVGSLGFKIGDKYLERAGMDYLDDIPINHVPDFQDVLAEKPGWTPYFLSTKAKRNYADMLYPQNALLVFGSETHGLPAWLIEENLETSFRIPMRPESRSLNLSNSVAIVLYEAIRQQLNSLCENG